MLAEKVTISRHGLPHFALDSDGRADRLLPKEIPLRIAFPERYDPVKGPDVLIKAFRKLPSVPVELDLYGTVQDAMAVRNVHAHS